MRIVPERKTAPEVRFLQKTPAASRQQARRHRRSDKGSEHADELRLANARLRALFTVGLELAAVQDPDRLFEGACMSARDLFGATCVTLGILDSNERTVQRVITCGADTPCAAAPGITAGDAVPGILGTVVAERRTVRGDNPGGDPGGNPVRQQQPWLHPDVQAFMAAAIASPARVYGWICVAGNEGSTFDQDDEELLTALAAQVGRICENLSLVSLAHQRAADLEQQILERRHAELATRREEDRAQRYLDAAEVILLRLDLDGRIALVNRYACAVLGWTAEELHGRDWSLTCLPARMRDEFRQQFRDLLGGDLSVVESPILARSGEERLVEWRHRLLRDDEGRVIGTFSSGADVTERHQAVDALRAAEERMRFALEAANIGIWDTDYTSGVMHWSEILESQYGLQPGAFGGTFEAFVERVHPDDRKSVLDTVGHAVKGGADFSLLNRSIRPDGAVRWLSGAGRIHLGEHGEPLRGVGISLDVTERRRLEEQNQQAQKMEAIGRLAGAVAHDFNNLLTVILGYCDLLLGDLDPGDPRREDMAGIQKAGTRAVGLTHQLLAFSRKQIIEPTLLDLNIVVAGMRPMLGRLIREDVTVVLSLGPVALVKADRGQMEQTVLNLALNARDAMPRGGTLTIETATVDLEEHGAAADLALKPGPYVALTVTDTGPGMTPEVQARVFEPFFTTKKAANGTGLGLATVHGIVAQSGGNVSICSEVGLGTSFKVYFPHADDADVVADAPAPVEPPPAGTETVLVVEDAEGLRELARKLLERQGYTVLVAANADEALQQFEQHASIDVLLTDVVMPGASGPELTRRLAGKRHAMKVIYMSGYTEDAIVQHGVLKPGIAFLRKPFTADALGRKIREVLDARASGSRRRARNAALRPDAHLNLPARTA